MIQYVKRKDLDVSKYDFCIEHSVQSRIYAFSWYLDVVANHWEVLVLDDYKAVMPIPCRTKFFIKYVYPPFWMLELGVFSLEKKVAIEPFHTYLFQHYSFVELRLNRALNLDHKEYFITKKMQVLSLNSDCDFIVKNYRKDRRKDLVKATKSALKEKWGDTPEKLITLFKNNVGKRTPHITNNDYIVLKKLITICIEKEVGEILSIYDSENAIVASGFFLKHQKEVAILVSSTDFKNRKNGANTYLIHSAICKYQKNFELFNFGGSSMQTIANYFLSFGAETKEYQQIKYNNLPFLLKLFKR
jgi:hypothetical protein